MRHVSIGAIDFMDGETQFIKLVYYGRMNIVVLISLGGGQPRRPQTWKNAADIAWFKLILGRQLSMRKKNRIFSSFFVKVLDNFAKTI